MNLFDRHVQEIRYCLARGLAIDQAPVRSLLAFYDKHRERASVTITHAASLVGVSRRTIYNWIEAGKVETVRTASGTRRIYVDSLWRKDS